MSEKSNGERRAPKTVKAALLAAIPALCTGYMNHIKDEASRAALVNESIRLEDRIDQANERAAKLEGMIAAGAMFGGIFGGGVPVPVDAIDADEPEMIDAATEVRIEKPALKGDPRSFIQQTLSRGGTLDEPEARPIRTPIRTATTPPFAGEFPKMKAQKQPPRAPSDKKMFKKKYESLF